MSLYRDYEEQPFLASLYDLVPRYAERGDIGFYADLCRRTGGKTLELGCGTGRVLMPIAKAGIEIVGLDLSGHMLAKCRENLASAPAGVRERASLIQASMTDFELGEQFSAIIIPFRPFQHLVAVEDQLACLRCAHRHLKPDGLLAFDVFQVVLDRIADPKRMEESEDLPQTALPDGRKLRRCNRFAAIRRSEQINNVELIYYLTDREGKTERLVQAFPFRYFFRYEVEHLLARAGFEIAELYGDFDRSPLGDTSPEMIFVARKADN